VTSCAVILNPDVYGSWLDPENNDMDTLNKILLAEAVIDLVYPPVSKQVNAVNHNDPSNRKPNQTEFDFYPITGSSTSPGVG